MDVTLIYRFKNHLSAWGFFSNHKYFPRFFTAFASSNEWTYIFSLSHFALSLALTWTLPINHIWQPIATVHLPLHRLRTTIISLLMGKSLHTPIFISRGRLGWQATRTQLRALTTHLKYCSALSNLYASNANILYKQRMSGRYTSILHNYPTDCCLLSVIPPEASHPLHLAQICPTFFYLEELPSVAVTPSSRRCRRTRTSSSQDRKNVWWLRKYTETRESFAYSVS